MPKTNEIFEEPAEIQVIDKKIKEKLTKRKVKKVIYEDEGVIDEPEPVVEAEVADNPVKKQKKKRVRTEAELQRLRDNLARGRATALKNRQRNAQLKKIKKSQQLKEEEALILEELQKKKESLKTKDTLRDEIESLRRELEQQKKPKKVIQRIVEEEEIEEPPKIIKVKKPKKAKKQKIIYESASSSEEEEEIIIKKKKKEKRNTRQPQQSPPPPPPKVQGFVEPQFSQKDLFKMMSRLR